MLDDHPDGWLRHVMDEVPTLADLEAGGERLRAQVAQWALEDAQRLAVAAAPRDVVTAREAVEAYIEEMRTERAAAIHTGWHGLDEQLGRSITRGELVLIASRPGVGKTWALQSWIETTLALDREAAAAIIEMEMLDWHMGERFAVHALRQPPGEVAGRARRDLEAQEVMDAAPLLERVSVHRRSLNVMQLPEAIDAATERLGLRPSILVVDYLGLLAWDGAPSASTYQRASDNARRLKDVAREQNVVVLAAAQLSRSAGSGSQRPSLSDMRDSGVIEEAADRIVGLWRDTPIEDENTPPGGENGDLLLCVLKNRHGRSNGSDVDLRYDASMRLVERGLEEQEPFPF